MHQALTIHALGRKVRMKSVFSIFNPKSGLILDCGCGPGLYCQKLVEKGCNAVGIDISVEQILLAKSLFKIPIFIVGDATRLPFRDGVFNAVLCSDVLEHITHDSKALGELHRVLTKGGHAVFTVPMENVVRWVWALRKLFGISTTFYREFYGHIRDGYDIVDNVKKLEKNGFAIKKAKYCYGFFSNFLEGMLLGIARVTITDQKEAQFTIGKRFEALLKLYKIFFPVLLAIAYIDFLLPWKPLNSEIAVLAEG